MRELPQRERTCIYEASGVKCFQYTDRNLIDLYLDNHYLNKKVINILQQRTDVPVSLYFKGSIKTLNQLFGQLSQDDLSNHIEIKLDKTVKIKKNTNLELENLSDNVKIHVDTDRDFCEFENWCLNLSDHDFNIVSGMFAVPEQAIKLCERRQLAKQVYLFLSQNVHFSKMTATEKMDYMFDWVVKNTSYDMDLIQADGNLRDDVDWSLGSDPVQVFKRKKGVCTGRSKLLKILLNNPYMGVNCYMADGYSGHLQHRWNEFIDENGDVYAYDLSYGIKHVSDITKCGIDHHDVKHSHVVNSILESGQFSSPPMPPRKGPVLQKLPPLPPRNH